MRGEALQRRRRSDEPSRHPHRREAVDPPFVRLSNPVAEPIGVGVVLPGTHLDQAAGLNMNASEQTWNSPPRRVNVCPKGPTPPILSPLPHPLSLKGEGRGEGEALQRRRRSDEPSCHPHRREAVDPPFVPLGNPVAEPIGVGVVLPGTRLDQAAGLNMNASDQTWNSPPRRVNVFPKGPTPPILSPLPHPLSLKGEGRGEGEALQRRRRSDEPSCHPHRREAVDPPFVPLGNPVAEPIGVGVVLPGTRLDQAAGLNMNASDQTWNSPPRRVNVFPKGPTPPILSPLPHPLSLEGEGRGEGEALQRRRRSDEPSCHPHRREAVDPPFVRLSNPVAEPIGVGVVLPGTRLDQAAGLNMNASDQTWNSPPRRVNVFPKGPTPPILSPLPHPLSLEGEGRGEGEASTPAGRMSPAVIRTGLAQMFPAEAHPSAGDVFAEVSF